jgi:hydroxymethylglutaryl-CoA synthase
VVGKNAAERIQRARLDEVIGGRERVTVEEYERLMALPPEVPPEIAPGPAAFRFVGVKDHRREYAGG